MKQGLKILFLSAIVVISDFVAVEAHFGLGSPSEVYSSLPYLNDLSNDVDDNPVLNEISRQLGKIKHLQQTLLDRHPELRDMMMSSCKRYKRYSPPPPGPDGMCLCNSAKGAKGDQGFVGFSHRGMTREEVVRYVKENAEKLCYEYCPRLDHGQRAIEREGQPAQTTTTSPLPRSI